MNQANTSKDLQMEEWIRKAEDDELNVKAILKDKDGTPNLVCFLSQQIAEKYLKAFLVFHKKWYPKIHPLDTLWELCFEIDNSFEEIKVDCVYLTKFYTPTRYPGDYPDFSWEDAEEAYAAAVKIKKFILSKIQLR